MLRRDFTSKLITSYVFNTTSIILIFFVLFSISSEICNGSISEISKSLEESAVEAILVLEIFSVSLEENDVEAILDSVETKNRGLFAGGSISVNWTISIFSEGIWK